MEQSLSIQSTVAESVELSRHSNQFASADSAAYIAMGYKQTLYEEPSSRCIRQFLVNSDQGS